MLFFKCFSLPPLNCFNMPSCSHCIKVIRLQGMLSEPIRMTLLPLAIQESFPRRLIKIASMTSEKCLWYVNIHGALEYDIYFVNA